MKLITNPFAISCILLLAAGCTQQRPDGLPKLYPVSLRVVQEGKPLDGASLVLRTADADALPWTIGGKTDDSGTLVLWTHGKYKGVPAGKFKVVVSKIVNEGEEEYLDALDRGDLASAKKIGIKSY